MIRKDVYFPDDYVRFLDSYNGVSFSEHVRRALYAYVEQIRSARVSTSPRGKINHLEDQSENEYIR